MQPTTSLSRKPAPFIGDYISRDYYQYLTDGYHGRHPTEQKSVFIAKELILETLEKFPNVSGLRFMYGQKEGETAHSRTIVLMACNDTSMDKVLPNLILVPKDYLTNTGERISIDQCWELFNRYVNRMCALMPEEKRKEMPRACFYGINTLKDLLGQEGCAGIRYHFGYNPATGYLPERYEAVLEAMDSNLQTLNLFVEEGQRCPTVCDTPGGIPGGIIPGLGGLTFLTQKDVTGQDAGRNTWLLADPADGALYEMVHYVSPSLTEAIQRSGIGEENTSDIYHQQFSVCLSLIAEGKSAEAKDAFKYSLEEMMKKYLFRN